MSYLGRPHSGYYGGHYSSFGYGSCNRCRSGFGYGPYYRRPSTRYGQRPRTGYGFKRGYNPYRFGGGFFR